MAVMMAATHPERVQSLVLYGCYARRVWAEDYPWAQTARGARGVHGDPGAAAGTGRPTCSIAARPATRRCRSGGRTACARRRHPATVRALMDMNSLVDVRALLPSLNLPTLLVHRTGDQLCPIGGSRWMAGQIAGSTMIELDGADHFVSGNPDQILDAFEPFIAATPKPEHHLALAAVAHASGYSAADGDRHPRRRRRPTSSRRQRRCGGPVRRAGNRRTRRSVRAPRRSRCRRRAVHRRGARRRRPGVRTRGRRRRTPRSPRRRRRAAGDRDGCRAARLGRAPARATRLSGPRAASCSRIPGAPQLCRAGWRMIVLSFSGDVREGSFR